MMPHTFRAATTQEAIEKVQKALGSDAMIVSVRQVPGGAAWQAWKQPEIEIVAMPPSVAPASETKAALSVGPEPKRPVLPAERAEALLSQLVSQMERPRLQTGRGGSPGSGSPIPAQPAADARLSDAAARLPAALVSLKNQLSSQGLDSALIKKMITACAETLSPRALEEESRVRNYTRLQLEASVRTTEPEVPAGEGLPSRKVICLVGPSGSGKTSLCAKLAAYHAKSRPASSHTDPRRIVWISADTIRTGAIAQAQAYTDLLEIPLRLAYTPQDLAEAVRAEAEAELILVDTPARNPRNKTEIVELGAFLTALPDRTTYLALPATSKESDLNEALAAFGPFQLKGLILSKLDETDYFGSCFNLAWRSQLPLAYFSDGPQVLGHLFPAESRYFAGMVVGERRQRALTANEHPTQSR